MNTFPITRRTALLSLTLTLTTAAVLCFCSCKTPEPGAPPAWVTIAATVAQQVAAEAVAADLQDHPMHRAAYQTAEGALTGLIDRKEWNAATFALVVQSLPIVMESPSGKILATTFISIYDTVTATTIDVQKAPSIEAVMRAARDGIRAGLNAAPVRVAPQLAPRQKAPVSVKRVVI